jgi:hypothetical protein
VRTGAACGGSLNDRLAYVANIGETLANGDAAL